MPFLSGATLTKRDPGSAGATMRYFPPLAPPPTSLSPYQCSVVLWSHMGIQLRTSRAEGSSLTDWAKAILFFLSVYRRTSNRKFLAFSKKTKSNDVVTTFFTWNNSFNLKNEHSDSIEKNRNKNMNIFHSILYILLIQICECRPGVPGLLFRDFLWFFFFQSDRPNIRKRIRL